MRVPGTIFLTTLPFYLCLFLPIPVDGQMSDYTDLTWKTLYFNSEGLLPNQLLEDSDGYIWLLTELGAMRFDSYGSTTFTALHADSTALPSDRVNGGYIDNEGSVWLCTDNGLSRFISEDFGFENFTVVNEKGEIVSMTCLLQTSANNYLAGTTNGILEFSPSTGFGRHIIPDSSVTHSYHYLNHITGLGLSNTDKNRILVSLREGFAIYNIHSGSIEIIELGYPEPHLSSLQKLENRRGFMLGSFHPAGEKWFTSCWGCGLVQIDPEDTAQFYSVEPWQPDRHPLTQNIVFDLTILDKNNILTCANTGINLFNVPLDSFFHIEFRHEKGFRDPHFRNILAATNGRIYLSTRTGLYVSNPITTLATRKPVLQIHAIHVKAKGTRGGYMALPVENHITLNKRERDVKIPFGLVNPTSPERIVFSYKLGGWNNDWISDDGARVATFTNLKGGNYTFEVKAVDKTNGYELSSATLDINIQKHLLEHTWFYFLALGILALMIISGMQLWTKNLRLKEEGKRKHEVDLTRMELKALLAQMNPHFIFNSMNSIKSQILSSSKQDASEMLVMFSRLIRNILDISDNQFVPLSKELEITRQYLDFEKIRFKDKLTYEITMKKGIDPRSILFPPLLMQPIVENAIWHGILHNNASGLLSIMVHATDNRLHIVIRDNGIGIEMGKRNTTKKARDSKSRGLQLFKERVDAYNFLFDLNITYKIMDLSNANAQGTKVDIEMDIINSDKIRERHEDTAYSNHR